MALSTHFCLLEVHLRNGSLYSKFNLEKEEQVWSYHDPRLQGSWGCFACWNPRTLL